jgi:hypothetical protein
LRIKLLVPDESERPAAVPAEGESVPTDERPEPVPDETFGRQASPEGAPLSGPDVPEALSPGEHASDLALASFGAAADASPRVGDDGWTAGYEHYGAAALRGLIVCQVALATASRRSRERDVLLAP